MSVPAPFPGQAVPACPSGLTRPRRGGEGSSLSRAAWLGPAFVASVAYMDPGNFATNVAGGARFGYTLLWVLLASNAMAILIQYLSAKLGIVTGRTLPENCRHRFHPAVTAILWLAAEAGALATDLAEVLGGALGLHLLLGLPFWAGALLTGAAVFLLLALEGAGHRQLEVVIMAFVAAIGLAFFVEIFLAQPAWGQVTQGLLRPTLSADSAYVAAAMLGATVMPHVVYLHSALVLPRRGPADTARTAIHLRLELADILAAMNGAWLVNSAILILAAATFFRRGLEVSSLEQAHALLTPLLGPLAGAAFGLALLASGLASSVVGTMAGQVILAGFLGRRLSPFLRRLVTLLPAVAILTAGVDTLQALVLSQVVLSLVLPFALIPLLLLTADRRVMGSHANGLPVNAAAAVVILLVLALNGFLLATSLGGQAVAPDRAVTLGARTSTGLSTT